MTQQAIDIPALAEDVVGIDGLFPRDEPVHDLLGRPLRARSNDPISGKEVSISLEDGRVREVEPASTVLSWPRADFPIGEDVVPAACGPINFFGSQESGRAFTERTEGTYLLTLAEGLELFRLVNRAVFGPALEDEGGTSR
jgi:hypothetical protein